jgi:ABC-2 type transport system permease protein
MRAFFVRDFQTETSYRFAFLVNFSSVFLSTFSFYFIAQLIDPGAARLPPEYDGDYFSYVIIGVAFAGYFGVGLRGFATAIRNAQVSGTLEAMLMTPTPLPALVVGSATWTYAFTTFRVVVYMLLGAALGMRFDNGNLLGGLVALLLAIVAFAGMGIAAAAVIMVIKRGDPVTALFGSVANLIGGVLFPIEVMPGWLQAIAHLLPITYALDALRNALLFGASWRVLWPDLAVLGLFCVVVFPLSLYFFRLAVQRARADGSLTHY